jgi:hypothetical protein
MYLKDLIDDVRLARGVKKGVPARAATRGRAEPSTWRSFTMRPLRLLFMVSLVVFGAVASPGTSTAFAVEDDVWVEWYDDDGEYDDGEYGDDPEELDEARCGGVRDPICRIRTVRVCEVWQFCAPTLCCQRWRSKTTREYFPNK